MFTTPGEMAAVRSLVAKIDERAEFDEDLVVSSTAGFATFLSPEELRMVEAVFEIEPRPHGFLGPKVGLEGVPDGLVRVNRKPYRQQGFDRQTMVLHLPEPAAAAYNRLNSAIEIDLGRPLLIESAYRSPAYQAVIFLKVLCIYEFDFARTARRAAVPGYSEHGTASSVAFDFLTVDGYPSEADPVDFETTEEFAWLCENAARHDFHMSYPQDNEFGVMYEPWHWRHRPAQSTGSGENVAADG